MMETAKSAEKKEKRPRGANWAPDALKACLEMGIVKRVKIKGCEAVGEARDEAWQAISDAVTATGQPKTPQECLNKLRTYPSEVKYKFLQISRQTVNKSGAGGGTPIKELQPTEIEELALAFLGIEKVADLEKKLNKVTIQVKKSAKIKYGCNTEETSDDDGDVDSLIDDSSISSRKKSTRSKKPIPNPSAATLNRILQTLDRIEDRLIRLEVKSDETMEDVAEVKREIKNKGAGGHFEDAIKPDDMDDEVIKQPFEKAKPRKIIGVPFVAIKTAFEDFIRTASEDDWDAFSQAVVTRKTEVKKNREHVYLKVIEHISEDDIDELQEYFITYLPEFVRDAINTKNHYHVITAVGCDLVAYGTFSKYLEDVDLVESAKQCRVLSVAPTNYEGAGDATGEILHDDKAGDSPGSLGQQEIKPKDKNDSATPPKGLEGKGDEKGNPNENPDDLVPKTANGEGEPVPSTSATESPAKSTRQKAGRKADASKDTSKQEKGTAPPVKKARRGRPAKRN